MNDQRAQRGGSSFSAQRRRWVAACAIGLAISVAGFSASVWATSVFEWAAQELAVERVRLDLEAHLGDETVSTSAAEHFLSTLPTDVHDFKALDRARLRELVHASAERECSAKPNRGLTCAARVPEKLGGPAGAAPTALNDKARRGKELVLEMRYASVTCAMLFGLGCLLLWTPTSSAAASLRAAKIATCGGALICFGSALSWYQLGGASQGYATSAIGAVAVAVLITVFDAAFNGSRGTRAVLELSRFWP